MAKETEISWTDSTFNPWIGCTKVSPGCTNCYAEALNKRWRKGVNWGKGAPRQRTSKSNWKQPLKWNKITCDGICSGCRTVFAPVVFKYIDNLRTCPECHGEVLYRRPRVFCASLADWLDDEVPIEWLADLLKLIHDTPNLDWQLLTKRPENWQNRIEHAAHFLFSKRLCDWVNGDAPTNVWIGTTVEDQKRAEERLPHLVKIPARIHFVSAEPLLESVTLQGEANGKSYHWLHDFTGTTFDGRGVDWVICGGESGRGKRPFSADWARSLRDQCAAASVPFFMKQIDKVQSIPDDLMVRQFPALQPVHV